MELAVTTSWIQWIDTNDNNSTSKYIDQIHAIMKQILDPCDKFDYYFQDNIVQVGVQSVISGVSNVYDSYVYFHSSLF